ncbi:MAG: ABC transporter permease [Elusimicrobia bacterium]|nr:ABC transporter permease [Elusimicrobiota bacterium]
MLAWRNLWRNARRTAITVVSVGSGLTGLLLGQSLIETIQVQLVDKATGVHTGHIQVLESKVADMKFPDRYIDDPDAVERVLRGTANVAAFQRRLVVTGLVSSKTESAGVMISGVEPGRDSKVLRMATYLKAGKGLTPGDGAYLGDALAAQLGVKLGDELVLMATAADGSMGAELARVEGLFHSGSRTFDTALLYVDVEKVQRLLSVEGRVNGFVLRLEDATKIAATRARLAAALEGLPLKASTWEEIDYELVGIRDYQDALLRILLGVVFVIVALGILNTLLMSMYERVREFGLLMALGARREFIARLVVAESVLIGSLGAGLGLLGGSALILYFARQGLELPVKDAVNFFMPFDSLLYLRFDWGRHLVALGAVFATCVLAGLPPALRAMKLKPAEALRHL